MSKLTEETAAWLDNLGFAPQDQTLWLSALTHGSYGSHDDYERLEFLGDRVLGLTIANWLYGRSKAPEGKLSQRLNALVSRETCARVALRFDLPSHIRMGKQARDDGGAQSTNILGDVMEALLGAGFIQNGFDATSAVIHTLWEEEVHGDAGTAKHPKSALQEWAAGNNRQPPAYELIDRSGPDHAARFTVEVSVHNVGASRATASNKQEAEKQAAKAFMEEFG
jgi:ribonuclease-3